MASAPNVGTSTRPVGSGMSDPGDAATMSARLPSSNAGSGEAGDEEVAVANDVRLLVGERVG